MMTSSYSIQFKHFIFKATSLFFGAFLTISFGNSCLAQNIPNSNFEFQNLDQVVAAGQFVVGNGVAMTNAPFANQDWWNVMSMRHHNPNNNFTTQIAGEFFGNRLAFRNIQNTSGMSWSEIFHSGNISTLKTTLNLKLADVTANGDVLGRSIVYDANQVGLHWHFLSDESQLYYANSSNGSGKVVMEIGDDLLPEQGFLVRGKRYDGLINNVAYFQSSGNVGIGTMTPNEKLAVNGNIRAKEIKVETSGWPDYVFADEYQKMSLPELKVYLKIHQHLPELPSAKEVETNGIALGEMNKILLKKVEELTLHLIEKDEAIRALKVNEQKVELLTKRLTILEKFLSEQK